MFNDCDVVDDAVQLVARFCQHASPLGVVLGTGSSAVAADIEIDHAIPYEQISGFPTSTALGHAGRLLIGRLFNKPVVAMDGRCHLYEGHDIMAVTLGVRLMHRLGVKRLVITNAAGGLNPNYECGDVMVIRSHIDLLWRQPAMAATVVGRPRPPAQLYDCQLAKLAKRSARANDFQLHEGVYAALLGPNYETRAEYRMLRRIGADVAGMSTAPEVNVAAKLGIRTLGLSIVTNVAKPDVLSATSGEDVIDAAKNAAPKIAFIVRDILADC